MSPTARGFMIGVAVGVIAYHVYAQSNTAKAKA